MYVPDELDDRVIAITGALSEQVRDPWHDESSPQIAHEAWAKVVDAYDRITDLTDAFRVIPLKAREAEVARLAEHRAHAAGGPKPRGTFKPVDVQGQRQDALFEITAAAETARRARAQYDELGNDPVVLAEWREALLAKFNGMQDRARDAVQTAELAFKEWARTNGTLSEVTVRLGLAGTPDGRRPPMGKHNSRSYWEAYDAFPVIDRVLNTTHVIASGRWATMTEEDLTASPPLWQRELWSYNSIGSREYHKLGRLELKERQQGVNVSSFKVPADITAEEAQKMIWTDRGLRPQ
ncbi:hypothetical protein [Streptomyces sp. NPDC049585]|uniref:hypothetical protein n=1 Tax=Streptomyces sp. NPDC049585 TaxID=3155154 RepID=UPI003420381E